MRRRKRTVVRLRSQALWERLARLQRSQNWLADELGIGRSYLSRLLNRGQAPSGEVRRRMQQVLGVEDFYELFYFERPGQGQ